MTWNRTRGLIISIGLKRFWSKEKCEDLYQDVALKCLKNPNIKLNPEKGTVQSLLRVITTNMIKDQIRKPIQLVPMDNEALIGMYDALAQDYSDENEEILKEQMKILYQSIKIVSETREKKTIDAFKLFKMEGLSAKEVGKKLSMSEGNVNSSVSRIFKDVCSIAHRLYDESYGRQAG